MPLSKFLFKPGINREGTSYDNSGGWFDVNLVRFRKGRPEKFADALVLYFGGSYNHYRELGELNSEERTYIEEYLAACTNT